MRIRSICVVALSVATATGCTRVIEVEPQQLEPIVTEPEAKQAPSSNSGDSSLRREFLDNIDSIAEGPMYLGDDELWELGLTTCEAVANGTSAQEIVAMVVDASEGDQTVIDALFTVTAAAIAVICPKYGYIFDNLT